MKQNELLYLVISIFVVTVFWIGFTVYHSYASSTLTETQNIQVIPIDPHFNSQVIEKLKARTKIDPALGTITVQASASPTPRVSPTPKASASPSAQASPSATPRVSL